MRKPAGNKVRSLSFLMFVCVVATSCGGSNAGSSNDGGDGHILPSSYIVGGIIKGMATGNSLVLQNNGGDDWKVTQASSSNDDIAFKFKTPVLSGSTYNVTVPNGQPISPN